MKNCKLGSYLNRVRESDESNESKQEFKMEYVRFEISDTYLIYIVKLQNYIQNAWQYLTSKNKVSGPFTTRNEEGLGLLRTLMFMGVKSEFPFTFTYKGKVYSYSQFLKKRGGLDLNNAGDKSTLMSYLSEQVGLMKLKLFKMKKQMKLKKQKKPTKPKTTKPKTKKPKAKKTTKELIKIAAKIKVPPKSRRRRRRPTQPQAVDDADVDVDMDMDITEFNEQFEDYKKYIGAIQIGLTTQTIIYNNLRQFGSPYSRIGDTTILYENDEGLLNAIKKSKLHFKLYLEKLREVYKEKHDSSGEILILPPIKNLEFINSKIDYMEILKSSNLVDNYVYYPAPSEPIDIKEVIAERDSYTGTNDANNPNRRLVVLKLPYSGGSQCVKTLEFTEDYTGYSYNKWLGIYLSQVKPNVPCAGFNLGIIIQPYNQFIVDIGEFRCFCVNGYIAFITFSNSNVYQTFPIYACREKLLKGNGRSIISELTETTQDYGDLKYMLKQEEIDSLMENLEKEWDDTLYGGFKRMNGDHVEVFKQFFAPDRAEKVKETMAKLEKVCSDTYKICADNGHPLSINRIDITISHDSDFTSLEGIKLAVNEIEDVSFGPLSINNINKRLNITRENNHYMSARYILGRIYENWN